MNDHRDPNAYAIIEGGALTIKIDLSDLQAILDISFHCGFLPTRQIITNMNDYTAELVRTLNAEEEDGSTMVHRMFDSAFRSAFEWGAEGIEDHPDQEPERMITACPK